MEKTRWLDYQEMYDELHHNEEVLEYEEEKEKYMDSLADSMYDEIMEA